MTKSEFVSALSARLAHLPQQERDKATTYYSEIVEDRMEDGMGEEEAVAALGSVEEAAQSAMLDMPLPVLVKARVNESRDKARSRTLWIVLAVAGAPFWLPVAASLAGTFFGLYLTLWGLIVTLFAVLLALGVAGLTGSVGGVAGLFTVSVPAGLFAIGASLAILGVALFLFKPVCLIAKWLALLTVRFVKFIKSLFIGKRGGIDHEEQ